MSDQRPPLVPRPVVSVLALGLLAGMFYTIHLDADPNRDYDGGRAIILFAFGVFAVLGVDISRLLLTFLRRRDDEDDKP